MKIISIGTEITVVKSIIWEFTIGKTLYSKIVKGVLLSILSSTLQLSMCSLYTFVCVGGSRYEGGSQTILYTYKMGTYINYMSFTPSMGIYPSILHHSPIGTSRSKFLFALSIS